MDIFWKQKFYQLYIYKGTSEVYTTIVDFLYFFLN